MSDSFLHHLITLLATLLFILIFFVGYNAGMNGWWWVAFTLPILYFIIYKLIDAH